MTIILLSITRLFYLRLKMTRMMNQKLMLDGMWMKRSEELSCSLGIMLFLLSQTIISAKILLTPRIPTKIPTDKYQYGINVGTKMRKFPLLVMNMSVRILGSVHVLAHALTDTGIQTYGCVITRILFCFSYHFMYLPP